MLDEFNRRNRAIRAALDIAAEHGWKEVTFTAIAARTGLGLAELRREFACRTDILKAFQAEIDADVLSRTKPGSAEHPPRDRLFDILMTRFEVLQPYKPALKRIFAALCCRPGETALLLPSSLDSQYWMLEGAGAKLQGPGAALRVAGLAAIYPKVFRVWLDDDTPGLDRTMAALDRRLKRGEDTLASIEGACARVCRIAGGFMPRGWAKRDRDGPGETPAPSPTPAGA